MNPSRIPARPIRAALVICDASWLVAVFCVTVACAPPAPCVPQIAVNPNGLAARLAFASTGGLHDPAPAAATADGSQGRPSEPGRVETSHPQ